MRVNPLVKHAAHVLLERNPDMIQIGRFLVLKPVNQIVRGVFIDRSLGKNQFTLIWGVDYLFRPPGTEAFPSWGDRPYRSKFSDGLTAPGLPELIADVIDEEGALTVLRGIQTLDDFAEFSSDPPSGHWQTNVYPSHRCVLAAARGDFDAALDARRQLREDPRFKPKPGYSWDQDAIEEELYPLLVARDRVGIGAVLRRWEYRRIQASKLTDLWEPTPYPVELMGQ